MAAAGDAGDALAAAACAALARALPFEFACLATTDPATGLITGAYKTDPSDTQDAEFVRLEYEVDDVNLFADIARRRTPVGVLEHDTQGRPEQSTRYRDFLVPNFDHGHELRAALRTGGQTWGAIALYRPVGGCGFTVQESAFVAEVAATIGDALRGQAIRAAAERLQPDGPAVLVLGAGDAVHRASLALEQHLDELGATLDGPLPIALLAVAAAVRARRAGQDVATRSTLRTAAGRWLVVQGAPLSGGDGATDDVVVTIEEAGPPEIVPLVVAALGLTPREQELCRLVLAGHSTAEIAQGLHLSPYTVQDHLKAIFEKAGVRSRRELTARVFHEHYAPRLGQPIGTSGWFA
jgi:DNA-binding CsgD family transcriptional regulator